MKPILVEPEAAAELDEAFAASRLVADFAVTIDAAWAMLSANPRIGAPVGRSEVRQMILRRFPYSLFYIEEPDAIRVFAFAHHKRRPGYWKSRLRP